MIIRLKQTRPSGAIRLSVRCSEDNEKKHVIRETFFSGDGEGDSGYNGVWEKKKYFFSFFRGALKHVPKRKDAWKKKILKQCSIYSGVLRRRLLNVWGRKTPLFMVVSTGRVDALSLKRRKDFEGGTGILCARIRRKKRHPAHYTLFPVHSFRACLISEN